MQNNEISQSKQIGKISEMSEHASLFHLLLYLNIPTKFSLFIEHLNKNNENAFVCDEDGKSILYYLVMHPLYYVPENRWIFTNFLNHCKKKSPSTPIMNWRNIEYKNTPLHYVMKTDEVSDKDRLEVAKLLIENGADINLKNVQNETPLSSATNCKYIKDGDNFVGTFFREHFFKMNLEDIKPYINKYKIDAFEDHRIFLIWYVFALDSLKIINLNEYKKKQCKEIIIDINKKDKNGDTLLHYFIKAWNEKFSDPLFRKSIFSLAIEGADPNIKNKNNMSAIDLVLEYKNIDLLKCFFDHFPECFENKLTVQTLFNLEAKESAPNESLLKRALTNDKATINESLRNKLKKKGIVLPQKEEKKKTTVIQPPTKIEPPLQKEKQKNFISSTKITKILKRPSKSEKKMMPETMNPPIKTVETLPKTNLQKKQDKNEGVYENQDGNIEKNSKIQLADLLKEINEYNFRNFINVPHNKQPEKVDLEIVPLPETNLRIIKKSEKNNLELAIVDNKKTYKNLEIKEQETIRPNKILWSELNDSNDEKTHEIILYNDFNNLSNDLARTVRTILLKNFNNAKELEKINDNNEHITENNSNNAKKEGLSEEIKNLNKQQEKPTKEKIITIQRKNKLFFSSMPYELFMNMGASKKIEWLLSNVQTNYGEVKRKIEWLILDKSGKLTPKLIKKLLPHLIANQEIYTDQIKSLCEKSVQIKMQEHPSIKKYFDLEQLPSLAVDEKTPWIQYWLIAKHASVEPEVLEELGEKVLQHLHDYFYENRFENHYISVIKVLLKNDFDLNYQDKHGNTILHHLFDSPVLLLEEIKKIITENKFNNLKNNQQITPLDRIWKLINKYLNFMNMEINKQIIHQQMQGWFTQYYQAAQAIEKMLNKKLYIHQDLSIQQWLEQYYQAQSIIASYLLNLQNQEQTDPLAQFWLQLNYQAAQEILQVLNEHTNENSNTNRFESYI